MKKASKAEARAYLGGFSDTAKMPCPSYGLSRDTCMRGKELRKLKGTVCASCYAAKGNYSWHQVREANQRRLERLLYSCQFVDMFTVALEGEPFFRFFDTGDIPNLSCLERVMDVAERCNWCRFWIPTREYATVSQYLTIHGRLPENVNVRISADYIDRLPEPQHVPDGCTFSTVATLKHPEGLPGAHCCTPTFEHEFCESCSDAGCRACWDRNVPHVCYRQH